LSDQEHRSALWIYDRCGYHYFVHHFSNANRCRAWVFINWYRISATNWKLEYEILDINFQLLSSILDTNYMTNIIFESIDISLVAIFFQMHQYYTRSLDYSVKPISNFKLALYNSEKYQNLRATFTIYTLKSD
jgi:hypothetical protein